MREKSKSSIHPNFSSCTAARLPQIPFSWEEPGERLLNMLEKASEGRKHLWTLMIMHSWHFCQNSNAFTSKEGCCWLTGFLWVLSGSALTSVWLKQNEIHQTSSLLQAQRCSCLVKLNWKKPINVVKCNRRGGHRPSAIFQTGLLSPKCFLWAFFYRMGFFEMNPKDLENFPSSVSQVGDTFIFWEQYFQRICFCLLRRQLKHCCVHNVCTDTARQPLQRAGKARCGGHGVNVLIAELRRRECKIV